ncbi:MAG: flippase-like domain-containing protein [Proteobacteria bacterium]|nr:MAG: flippase-like domain-containing protein [Pseudomonadota bacterium]
MERGPGPFKRIAPKLAEAYEALAILVSPKNLVLPAVISIGAWLLECMALWVILHGFGQTTAIPLCLFFYATSTLAGAIVPTPGGLGVTETLLEQGLTKLGHVSDIFATAAMILVRFATLWFAVLVGFVALTLLRGRPVEARTGL